MSVHTIILGAILGFGLEVGLRVHGGVPEGRANARGPGINPLLGRAFPLQRL
jgi:hypothetical protein